MRTYEGLLLVDATIASKEWDTVVEEFDRIVKRNGATVLQINKWGERKLAHHVKKNARGAYVLAYFSSPPEAVTKIRADIVLSEIILRSLIVAHEGELRKDPPRDFETAGPLPPKGVGRGFGGGRGGFGGGRGGFGGGRGGRG